MKYKYFKRKGLCKVVYRIQTDNNTLCVNSCITKKRKWMQCAPVWRNADDARYIMQHDDFYEVTEKDVFMILI